MSIKRRHLFQYRGSAYLNDISKNMMYAIGSTELSEYIPVHALTVGKTYYNDKEKYLIYGLCDPTHILGRGRKCTIRTVTSFLHDYGSYTFVHGDITYHSMKHMLYTFDKDSGSLVILYTMAMKKNALMEMNPLADEFDSNDFVIILNKRLKEKKFTKMRLLLERMIKESIYLADLDILTTGNVEQLCFRLPEIRYVPKFKTFEEMGTYLKLLENTILKK